MRLSVQLYTLRDPMQKDPEGTLREVRDMGLEYVELAGFYGRTVDDWKSMLSDIGLKVAGSHDGIGRLTADLDDVISESKELGNEYVVLPWIDEAHYRDGWDKFGKELEPLGRQLQDAGIVFGYHNHAFELALVDGKPALDILFEATDPNLVKAQLDIGWVKAGGQDPAAYVRKYGNRMPLVHLKDFSGSMDKTDAEAGNGVVDWDDVLAACNEVGVKYGAIEMDVTPDEPLTSVRRCAEFFQARGVR